MKNSQMHVLRGEKHHPHKYAFTESMHPVSVSELCKSHLLHKFQTNSTFPANNIDWPGAGEEHLTNKQKNYQFLFLFSYLTIWKGGKDWEWLEKKSKQKGNYNKIIASRYRGSTWIINRDSSKQVLTQADVVITVHNS